MKNQTDLTNKKSPERECSAGETKCEGDIRYVCRNGHWKSTSTFCPDDNVSK
ncbi:hypothetical protein V7024_15775 [Bacillus sp. JJ864]|uniref:hypothetical protein n=1 Tax=Bacillus sp. JJ864 TaxID=3122975 RepID=UPI003000EA72